MDLVARNKQKKKVEKEKSLASNKKSSNKDRIKVKLERANCGSYHGNFLFMQESSKDDEQSRF